MHNKKKGRRIIVIGAGASGLIAGAAAAKSGASVTVLEKNEKAGKKIYITGKGRCNLTNDCSTAEFFDHVVTNPRFLYSSIYSFDHDAVKAFMEQNGCTVKTERGERVFPVTDHASDVTKALVSALSSAGGRILYHKKAEELIFDQESPEQKHVCGVRLSDGEELPADAVIVCTGGLSYPSTGSTGDGYRFAKEAGHTVLPCEPSLVSFHTEEDWPRELEGLSLKNVSIRVIPNENPDSPADANRAPSGEKVRKHKSKPVYEGFGEMLFTHFGVSGPLVLAASSRTSFRKHPEGYKLYIDLKPAIPQNELAERIEKMLAAVPDRQFVHAAAPLFPARLLRTMVNLSGIDPERKARTVNSAEIRSFAELIHAVPLTVKESGGFDEAVITRGGVNVKEINPSTMESKLVSGLYFGGEVIDVDAVTGGFNLQIAWSTGHLAGQSAAEGGNELALH